MALAERNLGLGTWKVDLVRSSHLRVTWHDNPIPPDYYVGLALRGFELCGAPLDRYEVQGETDSFAIDYHYSRAG